jgi:hypothetical protein
LPVAGCQRNHREETLKTGISHSTAAISNQEQFLRGVDSHAAYDDRSRIL